MHILPLRERRYKTKAANGSLLASNCADDGEQPTTKQETTLWYLNTNKQKL